MYNINVEVIYYIPTIPEFKYCYFLIPNEKEIRIKKSLEKVRKPNLIIFYKCDFYT